MRASFLSVVECTFLGKNRTRNSIKSVSPMSHWGHTNYRSRSMKITLPTRLTFAAIRKYVNAHGYELKKIEGDDYAVVERRMAECDGCGEVSRLVDGLCDGCTTIYRAQG